MTMLLSSLSMLGRLAALTAAILVLGLNAKFLAVRAWLTGPLVYIEFIAATGIIGALIPPYPNFLYDLVWGLVWSVAAIFALVTQFLESNCYGFQPDNPMSCATYKASTAFAFLAMFSWMGSAIYGSLHILGLVGNSENQLPSHRQSVGATVQYEAVNTDKIPRVRGVGNSHIAKYPIRYGILAILLIVITIPILVVYAAPAFIRYLIENTPIPNNNLQMTLANPTNDTISLDVTSGIHVPDAVQMALEPTNMSLFLVDRDTSSPSLFSFGSLDLPQLSYQSKQQVVLHDQILQLGDIDQFAALVETVLFSSAFTVGSYARVKVNSGAISTWATWDKTLGFEGFSGFPNLSIQVLRLQTPDADGYNLNAKMEIHNPTPATVTLGNITFDLLVGQTVIGAAKTTLADFGPGSNILDVQAKLDSTSLQQHILSVMHAEIPYLQNEEMTSAVSVASVVYEGQPLGYWEAALGRLEITLTQPVRPLVQSLLDHGLPGGQGGFLNSGFVELLLDEILDQATGFAGNGIMLGEGALAELGQLTLELLHGLGVL